MAMKTASPWWFSALFAAGLLFVFLGERPFDHIDSVHVIFTGLGLVLLAGITALRVWTYSATRGERRAVERVLLLCQAGVLLSLVIYAFTTEWGQGVVGVDSLEGESLERYVIPMTILWSIVMAVSLVPLLMIELSLGTARRARFSPADMAKSDEDEEAVESFRVREMATSGLTIALAAALLMVTCNVADQRNIRKDVSYFKTSSPGSATINIVKSVSEPVKVHLFFPDVNQVKNEVRGYFESLRDATGKVEIAEHDRLLDVALAEKFKINDDGIAVIEYGDKHEKMKFTIDPKRARSRAARTELRELDGEVNSNLMKVVRKRRTVYLTVGHGELNETDSRWSRMGMGMKANELRRRLRSLNFQVKDLGVNQGLANEVPDDAELVMVLGPTEQFLDQELEALDRYLGRGGRLLFALDPASEVTLGVLEGRLGVRFDPTLVVDDKQFIVQTRTISDRRFIKTNRFSSHASITTLSRAATRYATVFIETGSLEEVDFAEGKGKAKRTHVIRSMPSSFADIEKNFKFDAGVEKRRQYNLVTAVEDPTAKPEAPAEDGAPEGDEPKGEGMRAMVFSDVQIFADVALMQLGGARAMLDDAIKWLGGEEHLAGDVVSEKDVYIEHTRNEDVLWFYSTIMGAPLVVLGFGLWFGWWRRQRMQRRSS